MAVLCLCWKFGMCAPNMWLPELLFAFSAHVFRAFVLLRGCFLYVAPGYDVDPRYVICSPLLCLASFYAWFCKFPHVVPSCSFRWMFMLSRELVSWALELFAWLQVLMPSCCSRVCDFVYVVGFLQDVSAPKFLDIPLDCKR